MESEVAAAPQQPQADGENAEEQQPQTVETEQPAVSQPEAVTEQAETEAPAAATQDVEMTEATTTNAADATAASTENTEQFTINEETVLINDQPVQVISLLDAGGKILDRKQGQVGTQVIMELQGQAFAYEVRGPTETGEPMSSTLLLSTGEAEEQQQQPAAQPSEAPAATQGAAEAEQLQWSANGVSNCPLVLSLSFYCVKLILFLGLGSRTSH